MRDGRGRDGRDGGERVVFRILNKTFPNIIINPHF